MAAPFTQTKLDANHGWDPLNDAPIVALNNRLAAIHSVCDVTADDIAALDDQFQVSLVRDYAARLKEFYADYVRECLADRKFVQEEVNGLWHLKALFQITDEQHTQLYRAVATEVYTRTVEEVMGDFNVSEEEKQLLQKLGEYLELPTELRGLAFDVRAQMMLHDAFAVATGDGALSDGEYQQLRILQKQLGRSLDMTGEDRATFHRARLIWVIKYAPKLEPITVPCTLRPQEQCYYRHPASFVRLPSTKQPLLKREELKAKWNNDAFWHPEADPVECLNVPAFDSGPVLLTNRRLILDGQKQDSELPLYQVEDFDACPLWVDIRCNGGKMLRLLRPVHPDVFAHYLARLLRDS